MDNNQLPSFEIPKTPEADPVHRGSIERDPNLSIEESKEILPEPAFQSTTPDPSPALPTVATLQIPVAGSQVQAVQADDSHVIADDVDVMEKEWVDRAKKIIALTSGDPFVESKELGKLKATYIKKRFNKDIPADGDGASS